MRTASTTFRWIFAAALLALPSEAVLGQIDQQQTPEWKREQSRNQQEDAGNQASTRQVKVPKEVKVGVEMDKVRSVMAPWALGVHSTVSDGHLTDPEVISLLRAAGITTVRYPGGRAADTYHWSTFRASNWQGLDHPNLGYAPVNNLGSFALFMEKAGTTIFTVNYGSNISGTGGGDPEEAAAWVAYANGTPTDTKAIGKDSAGNDWQTVGYWASLRASAPLPNDDGKNFLRIQHPAPLGIRYWEVGNEVFQNGFYGGEGQEQDQHAPYAKNAKDNEKLRKKQADLGPESYGKHFLEFAKAMKAVDPRIKLGAPMDIPLAGQINRQDWTQDPVTGKFEQKASVSVEKDFGKGLDWDKGVLSTAGNDIDFVTLHWYPGDTTEESGFKNLDNYKLLAAPQDPLRQILAALVEQMQKYCGQHARSMQVAFTEIAPVPFAKVVDPVVPGLFAADIYPSLMEYGVINVDWAELHSGGFLDDHNMPGAAYFGMQMVHGMINYNDALVAATSSSSMLSVHAAKRADGSLGLMLINKDPKNSTTVKISVNGVTLSGQGIRFDYGSANPPEGNAVSGKKIEGVGNSFSVPMPPLTVTVFVIPKSS